VTRAPTPNPLEGRSLRAPVLWGVVWGVIQAAAPLGFWWLDPATVYALSLALIAAVYIGFAVAPLGRCCLGPVAAGPGRRLAAADTTDAARTVAPIPYRGMV
jgi:hypothetical protein